MIIFFLTLKNKMQQMQLQHKRFIQLDKIQSLSEQEWCALVYSNVPATNSIGDEQQRPKRSHT